MHWVCVRKVCCIEDEPDLWRSKKTPQNWGCLWQCHANHMLPNVAEHGIGYPNLFYFFTNLMIYLLIASSCAENYPPAGICNMVLKTQYFFSKVKRLSKSCPRHMRENVQPFAGEYGAGGPPPERQTGGEPSASKQADGRWQMAANEPGLMVSQKLFTQKKYPRAFSENTVYKEQRVLSFQRPQTFSCFSYLLQISIVQFYVLSFFFFHMFS